MTATSAQVRREPSSLGIGGQVSLDPHSLRLILRRIQELPLPPAANVLEVGCGAGALTLTLAERGYSVQAVNIADSMPEMTRVVSAQANARHRRFAPPVLRRKPDPRPKSLRLPFADHCFDLVLAIGVVPRFQSMENALHELVRVLKPGAFAMASMERGWPFTRLLAPFPWLRSAAEGVARTLSLHPANAFCCRPGQFDRAIKTAGMYKLAGQSFPRPGSAGGQYLVVARKNEPCPFTPQA